MIAGTIFTCAAIRRLKIITQLFCKISTNGFLDQFLSQTENQDVFWYVWISLDIFQIY